MSGSVEKSYKYTKTTVHVYMENYRAELNKWNFPLTVRSKTSVANCVSLVTPSLNSVRVKRGGLSLMSIISTRTNNVLSSLSFHSCDGSVGAAKVHANLALYI